MSGLIHPTAIIHPGAKLAADVKVGPYSIIGEHVEIGEGTVVGPHVVIDGHTTIGRHNQIFQFCSLGEVPQDKKYKGEPTRLVIGDHNVIRESCTFNIGTVQDRGETTVGSHNWIMAYVHIAHDCVVGNHTIFANQSTLAGHVIIDDYVILGGFTGVHQFCRIGESAITGIASVVRQNVPPYLTVSGTPAAPFGINAEGLKRRGFSPEAVSAVKRAYKTLYRQGLSLEQARESIATEVAAHPELAVFVEALASSERGIVR